MMTNINISIFLKCVKSWKYDKSAKYVKVPLGRTAAWQLGISDSILTQLTKWPWIPAVKQTAMTLEISQHVGKLKPQKNPACGIQSICRPMRIVAWYQKNPTYGRQSISQPMWIVAPIPKNSASKAKFVEFFPCRDFTPFMSKSFEIWDYFSPKDFESLISLDIGLREVGQKDV